MKLALILITFATLSSQYVFAEELKEPMEIVFPNDVSVSVVQDTTGVMNEVLGEYKMEIHISGLQNSIMGCTWRRESGALKSKAQLEEKLDTANHMGKMVAVAPLRTDVPTLCESLIQPTNLDARKVIR